MRWLESLVWPEHHHRLATLRASARIARADPPNLVRGDLIADLPAMVAQAPPEAAVVVFHSAVLTYVSAPTRGAFGNLTMRLAAHWVSNEGMRVLDGPATSLVAPPPEAPATFLISLNGEAVAFAGPHGQALRWLTEEDFRR